MPPTVAPLVWPRVAQLVLDAVEATDLGTLFEIAEAVAAGRSLIWLALDGRELRAVATTELRRTERSLVCVITACAGQLGGECDRLLAGIEDYARAEGCSCVRLFGRRGWARKLKEHYVQRHVVLERQL